MARTAALPVLNGESGLSRYLAEIRKFPMLEPQQEYMLAKRWREHDDRDAAHQLVTSHLRLVAKIAMGYRGYGLPISEVVSEGNVGLMQAVKRFEPEKGFRLATYAMWWIKASIQEYILRSWSLVKMGTTANQKKLFFNLRKAKSKISALEEGDMRPDQVELIVRVGQAANVLVVEGTAARILWIRQELTADITREKSLQSLSKGCQQLRAVKPQIKILRQQTGADQVPQDQQHGTVTRQRALMNKCLPEIGSLDLQGGRGNDLLIVGITDAIEGHQAQGLLHLLSPMPLIVLRERLKRLKGGEGDEISPHNRRKR